MPKLRRRMPGPGVLLRTQPDARLVALFREGHPQAFAEIVRRYRPGLVAFAAAIVPTHRAEDVVQDALLRASSALRSSDAEINLKPWLYAIARNRALNDLRDEHVHDELDENFDGVPQPPEVAARRAEVAALVRGLKGLPDAQRVALVGRELEGRTHEEIALALGTTPGSVRGLIFRARAALRVAAGALVPLPLLRLLLDPDPSRAQTIGAGGMAAGAAAGGSGAAVKAGTAMVAAVFAIGGGYAVQDPAGSPAQGPGGHRDNATRVSLRGARPAAGAKSETRGSSSGRGEDGSLQSGDNSGPGGPGGQSGSGEGGSSGPGPGGGSGESGYGGGGGGGDRVEVSAPSEGSGSGDSGSGPSGSESDPSSGSGESGSGSGTDGSDDAVMTTTAETTGDLQDG